MSNRSPLNLRPLVGCTQGRRLFWDPVRSVRLQADRDQVRLKPDTTYRTIGTVRLKPDTTYDSAILASSALINLRPPEDALGDGGCVSC
jgi:hypothetical protein